MLGVVFKPTLAETATTKEDKMEFTAKAKAFAGEGVRKHRFMVENGTVRVFDPVAGHFTTVHSLRESAERRLLKAAEERGKLIRQ
jgi:hypothetical protein